jgi:integrase/recombinase XerD
MTARQRKQLAYNEWPQEIRQRWEAAFKAGDFLDDMGAGAHLALASRAALKAACGRFLGFLKGQQCPLLFDQTPENQVNPAVIIDYVQDRRQSCSEQTIATELHHLRLALRLICPDADWTWLLIATKRIAAQAKPKRQKHHLVTSERLYALGFALMDKAMETASAVGAISKACAFDYRDGLMIVLLAAIPMRRRTFAALRIGKQLVKSGNLWALDIGAEDTKNQQALEFSLSAKLSARIDLYLEKFRKRIPGANNHDGVWASNKGRVMDAGTIYDMVRRRTRKAFGFPVNLHRFRHAATTFWSIRDPKNVRGTKDLLGHASFTTTDKHYIMSQSRLAGRRLAQIVDHTSGKGG